MNNLKFYKLYLAKLFNRYFLKFKVGFFKKIVYCLLVIAFLLFLYLLWKKSEANLSCPAVSEGIVGVYNSSNLPTNVTTLLSDPLFLLDKSGKPSPKIIESFQANADNTIYTLALKKDLLWNDGIKVKSSDIKINLPDIEVTYPDDSTIRFKLADSFTPFLTLLTSPVLKPGTLVGLGKYKVNYQELSHGHITKLILEPIERRDCINNPFVSIRFYQDESTARTAFELGEIDVELGIQDLSGFKEANIIIKKIQSFNKLVAIFYNTKDNILDKNYRKALNYATSVVGNEDEAKTSIPPTSWAFNTDLKDAHSDLGSSKTFLNKVDIGKDKPVTLTTTPIFNSLAEKIAEDWKRIGINVVVRTESGIPQNFQALLTTVSIPHDPDQYSLWHSTQVNTNLSKYSSPRVDKDLEDGRKTSDMEIRKEKYWDFQKVLQDDVPATFLYFPKINVVYRKKVENNLNKILSQQLVQF